MILAKHIWILFILATCANARWWWSSIQYRIRKNSKLEPGYRKIYRGYLFWFNLPWLLMGIGILTGQVESLFDFFIPGPSHPFVDLWWSSIAALTLLFAFWVFFMDGDEFLARHPGAPLIFGKSTQGIRYYTIFIIVWNAGLIYLFLSPGQWDSFVKAVSSSQLFPVFFIAAWILVILVLSYLGGWQSLAKNYRTDELFEGKTFRFKSGTLGAMTNYGGILTLGSNPEGLYMSVMFLFRFGHPPLFIPWSDVAAYPRKFWFRKIIDLEFAQCPDTSLKISQRLAEELAGESGGQLKW